MTLSLRRTLICIGLPMMLAACGGGGAPVTTSSPQAVTPPPSDGRPVSQSDADIAALIYGDTQRTPAGFYAETLPTFTGYVSTAHIKAPDVGLGARPYELCTDDWNQALQWSDSATANGSSQDALTGNEETPMYFEFDRVRSGTPQGYIRQRVFKCAFVNRDDVDLRQAAGPAGTLKGSAQAAELKQLSEYLWTFTSYNNTGNVVLKSVSGTSAGAMTQTLYLASLTPGTAGACDAIEVLQWTHTLDAASGVITRSIQSLWSFAARQQGGSVELCPS
jgi:hypothetical protein